MVSKDYSIEVFRKPGNDKEALLFNVETTTVDDDSWLDPGSQCASEIRNIFQLYPLMSINVVNSIPSKKQHPRKNHRSMPGVKKGFNMIQHDSNNNFHVFEALNWVNLKLLLQ